MVQYNKLNVDSQASNLILLLCILRYFTWVAWL